MFEIFHSPSFADLGSTFCTWGDWVFTQVLELSGLLDFNNAPHFFLRYITGFPFLRNLAVESRSFRGSFHSSEDFHIRLAFLRLTGEYKAKIQ
jgi:hypothetical protein